MSRLFTPKYSTSMTVNMMVCCGYMEHRCDTAYTCQALPLTSFFLATNTTPAEFDHGEQCRDHYQDRSYNILTIKATKLNQVE